MDFSLSPELEELRQATRRFVVSELQPLEVEVELADGHLAPEKRAELQKKLKPLGVHSASLPQSMGGTGHSWEAQVVINEEIGKVTNALGWLVWAPAIVLRHASPLSIHEAEVVLGAGSSHGNRRRDRRSSPRVQVRRLSQGRRPVIDEFGDSCAPRN